MVVVETLEINYGFTGDKISVYYKSLSKAMFTYTGMVFRAIGYNIV